MKYIYILTNGDKIVSNAPAKSVTVSGGEYAYFIEGDISIVPYNFRAKQATTVVFKEISLLYNYTKNDTEDKPVL